MNRHNEALRDEVMQALKSAGPGARRSLYAIGLYCGTTHSSGKALRRLRTAVASLEADGSLRREQRGKNYVYSLVGAEASTKIRTTVSEFAIAGPITIPQQRWGSSRLG